MSAAPSTIAQNDNFVPASKAIKGELETALMAAPQITADTNQMITFRQFSILSEPKLEKQGDSTTVSIDAVYLTDDGLEDTKIEVSQSVSADKIIDTKPERLRLSRLYTQTAHFSEPQVITLSKMPHPKHLVTPNFPSLANSLGKEGEVWVRAYLDESGKVKEAEIYKNSDSDYGFEEEALSAAYKNEFEPLEVDGQKLPAWIIYKVKFIRSK
jgi:TonB family protein